MNNSTITYWVTERRNTGRRNADKAPGALLYALSVADWLDWDKMPVYEDSEAENGQPKTK